MEEKVKKDRDVTVYKTIASPDARIKLSVGYDVAKNYYYMPSLKFSKKDPYFPGEFWDNDKYIFDTFLPFLNRWKKEQLLMTDRIEFSNCDKLTKRWVNEVRDVLKTGVDLGWDKLEL